MINNIIIGVCEFHRLLFLRNKNMPYNRKPMMQFKRRFMMKRFLKASGKLLLLAALLIVGAPLLLAFSVVSPVVGALMIILIPIILIGIVIGLRTK